jgi:hypothetical protein
VKSPSTTEQPITITYLQIIACNLDQIRHIDFPLAALCFTTLILTVMFIIVMKRKLARRSSLYADIIIATANEIVQLKIRFSGRNTPIFRCCSFAATWITSSLSSLLRNCDHN